MPLSACSLTTASEPSSSPTASAPEETPDAEPAEETPDAASSRFTFEDGTTLTGSSQIQWGDGLYADDGWELTSPDDGNGNWGYTTVDGSCAVAFWQGTLDELTLSGDDSTDSDALIAFFLETTVEQVGEVAGDTELGYQTTGAGGLDARWVIGQQDDRTWSLIARSFSAAGVGVYLLVDCSGVDADPVISEVVGKTAVVIM